MGRIELIERSLRCFAFGLASLIPVFGIPMAVLAVLQFRTVALGRGREWNPADRYLLWGFLFAGLGLLLSSLVFGLIMLAVLEYLSH
jgi:hypothetical protein